MKTVLTKGVILVSGGLDSTTLMYQFVAQNVEFVPLFINYGQHCANKEYGTLLKVVLFCKKKREFGTARHLEGGICF